MPHPPTCTLACAPPPGPWPMPTCTHAKMPACLLPTIERGRLFRLREACGHNPDNTEKLELPSISQVHSRGPVDSSWYSTQFQPRPTVSSERLPALPQIQSGANTSSNSSSPRGGSISSASAIHSSASSHTSYSSSINGGHSGFKTPSPEQTPQTLGRDPHSLNGHAHESPYTHQHHSGYSYGTDTYGSMNQMQSYPDVNQQHMSATPTHATSTGPPSTMGYTNSLVQGSYYPTSYGNGLPTPSSSGMSSALIPAPLPLPAMSSGGPGGSVPGSQGHSAPYTFDTTGQIAPPGMKPRVTATLWEDEGSLCFQVEARGVCVARREDDHFINGTKLLNVAGMTRGRRDGILKSEKTRRVVKIGPMHLKGVWIPYERALDFANKEKITESLYPLFVQDIGALLYHPSNARNPGGTVAAALDRRRPDSQQRYIGAPTGSQPPSLHHHHSLSNPSIGAQLQQSPHSIAPHPSAGRPGMDRAHTFPTPPTSASSLIGMGSSGSSYEWGSSGVSNMQGNQPLSIDTGLSNARSVPTTPATTPPGNMPNMSQYPTSQGYDSARPMYSAPPNQPGQYGAPQSVPRYAQPVQSAPYHKTEMAPFGKSEMAPPVRAGGEPVQQADVKPVEGLLNQGEHVGPVAGEEEADHEHDNEYTHTSGPYSNRGAYSYASSTGGLSGEHVSPKMTGSPRQNGSGRATPRSAQTGWARGYGPSGTSQLPSSNLFNVMSDTRSSANGNGGPDGYPAPAPLHSGYASQYSPVNGSKRIRELDDDETDYGRPASRDASVNDIEGLKRRKTITESTMGGAVGGDIQRAKSTIAQRRR
ncbi:apses transcription factor-like protein StuA [Phyllosticta citricarpa]